MLPTAVACARRPSSYVRGGGLRAQVLQSALSLTESWVEALAAHVEFRDPSSGLLYKLSAQSLRFFVLVDLTRRFCRAKAAPKALRALETLRSELPPLPPQASSSLTHAVFSVACPLYSTYFKVEVEVNAVAGRREAALDSLTNLVQHPPPKLGARKTLADLLLLDPRGKFAQCRDRYSRPFQLSPRLVSRLALPLIL